ncbi:MAG TPA: glycine betaine/L-proline ABC transporter ATP-binding protein [Alphaproteobacteria bacterium]|nr:glycine betaine/L-proline ABC transporter ATP-binding protein [Alphaproteobacteria bacterium]
MSNGKRAKIELKGVTKIFGDDPARILPMIAAGVSKAAVLEETGHTVGLYDVTLDIPEGQIFVVMGLSGSGKSTLIRHLNRLIDPTAGQVLVDGEDVTALDAKALTAFRRSRMSMVFQRFGLFPHRTVLENISFGLDLQVSGRPGREANREKARIWITAVGLDGYEDAYPHALSGGMQQRVGLARALAMDADILLMDEAFSALDPLIRRDMQDQLIELQSRLKKTIVFITHDLDEALRLGDRIAILKDGEVVQVGSGEEILTAPATRYVADFVEDVNRSRVLTAGTVQLDCVVVTASEAPAAALARAGNGELQVTYVVDADGKLLGAVTGSRLRRAIRENLASMESLIEPVQTATANMVLEEVLPLTLQGDLPVAVVDGHGRVQGMLSRRSIIAALAETAGVVNPGQ